MATASKSVFKLVPCRKFIDAAPSVWREFNALAKECAAVNLAQGFPNTVVPRFVIDSLHSLTENTDVVACHQYTRGSGHPRLVNALSRIYERTLKVDIDPEVEVLVTVGAYLSLYYAFMAWLNAGDEVIILEPAFDCYVSQIDMAGGIPVPVLLQLSPNATSSAEYTFDLKSIEEKITSRTKILVLNNPHNPTGKLFTREELCGIAELCKKYNLIIVADEVYEWHIYPGHEMIRFASLPDMYERTITIGSAGKTFSVTGWKIGWSIGPEHLLKPMAALHQNCVFTCATPLQEAVAKAFEVELDLFSNAPENSFLLKELAATLLQKRNRMADMLRKAGMKPIIPDSGYFMIADFSDLVGSVFPVESATNGILDDQFVRWLCKEHKLATIPPTAFYSNCHKMQNDHFIRVCFLKNNETLEQAEVILKKLGDQKRT